MADNRETQLGNVARTHEAQGSSGGFATSPLTSIATSNALLSHSIQRGGGAACRHRSRVTAHANATPITAHWHKDGHTKVFNLPDELARYTSDGIEHVGVKSIRSATIELKLHPNLPWGDHYDISPFPEGTGQRIIAEVAAEKYDNPALSLIGGFFFRIYREKDRVSMIFNSLFPMHFF